MLDLERHEKFIILFLIAILLAGLAFKLCQKSNQIIDVKIRPFDYASRAPAAQPKININNADVETLTELDGIGKAKAGRIVKYREENGRFVSTEELKKVKGIGGKLFERIKDEVSVE